MTHNDYEKEPVPGLPEHLPEGEKIVWQGAPDRSCFMRRVLHARKLALYFAALVVWRIGAGIYDGTGPADIALSAVWACALATIVLAMAWWFARAVERTTIYTITNKRVVMRIGIAIPITFNLPFSQILSADMRRFENGYGTIALTLKENTKISWAVLWPHARPWKLARPQPAIRTIARADTVAGILTEGLRAIHGPQTVKIVPKAAEERAASPAALGDLHMEGA